MLFNIIHESFIIGDTTYQVRNNSSWWRSDVSRVLSALHDGEGIITSPNGGSLFETIFQKYVDDKLTLILSVNSYADAVAKLKFEIIKMKAGKILDGI